MAKSSTLLHRSNLRGCVSVAGMVGFGVSGVGPGLNRRYGGAAPPNDAIQGRVAGLAGMHDVDDYPEAVVTPGLMAYRYDAPLSFASSHDITRQAAADVARRHGQQPSAVRRGDGCLRDSAICAHLGLVDPGGVRATSLGLGRWLRTAALDR